MRNFINFIHSKMCIEDVNVQMSNMQTAIAQRQALNKLVCIFSVNHIGGMGNFQALLIYVNPLVNLYRMAFLDFPTFLFHGNSSPSLNHSS